MSTEGASSQISEESTYLLTMAVGKVLIRVMVLPRKPYFTIDGMPMMSRTTVFAQLMPPYGANSLRVHCGSKVVSRASACEGLARGTPNKRRLSDTY